MTDSLNYQLLVLSALLQIQNRARQATLSELEFLIVNGTHSLMPYQQSALWYQDENNGKIAAVSGVAIVDHNAPYLKWLNILFTECAAGERAKDLCVIQVADLSAEVASQWSQWLPSDVLWVPMLSPDGKVMAAMIFARTQPWSEGDQQLLATLSGAYAQSLYIARCTKQSHSFDAWFHGDRRKMMTRAAAALLLVGVFPVHQSVLAPAEVVPITPALIRAPFDGVINTIHVVPNAPVHKGDKLASLDVRQVKTRYETAEKSLQIVRTEFSQTAQEALLDPRVKGRLSILHGKIEQEEAEVEYAKSLLDRADIIAPTDGVAVIDDVSSLIGKPVALGERIMLVASPEDIELEIEVPVASISTFAVNSDVSFFSNVEPDHATPAHLTFASYGSSLTSEGVLAYRFRAAFEPQKYPLRLGLKGTAKIYGSYRPLFLWMFRRPIALISQWISL